MAKILVKRGSFTQIRAAAAADQLSVGEIYLAVDRHQLVVAIAEGDYSRVGSNDKLIEITSLGTTRLLQMGDGAVQNAVLDSNSTVILPPLLDTETEKLTLVLTNDGGPFALTIKQPDLLPVGSYTATGYAAGYMSVSGAGWTSSRWVGSIVQMTSGALAGVCALITYSDSDMLGFESFPEYDLGTSYLEVSAGDEFSIYDPVDIAWVGGVAPELNTATTESNILVFRGLKTMGWIGSGGPL